MTDRDEDYSRFDSIQNDLDTFIEQEKVIHSDNKKEKTAEPRNSLDEFIDDLHEQVGSFIKETSANSKNMASDNDMLKSGPAASNTTVQTPARKIVKEKKRTSGSSFSFFWLAASIVIIAVCTVAVVRYDLLKGQFPQLIEQIEDKHQLLTASLRQAESIDKKPVIIIQKSEPAPEPEVTTPEPQAASEADIQPALAVVVETEVEAKAPTVTLKVDVHRGSIRDIPSNNGAVLYQLKRGTLVTKLAEQGQWFQIRLGNGAIAWAPQFIFELAAITEQNHPASETTAPVTRVEESTLPGLAPTNDTKLPEQTDSPTLQVADQSVDAKAAKLTVGANIGNVRSSPSLSSPVVHKLKKSMVVIKLDKRGDWYKIQLENGLIAWAHKSIF